MVRSLLQVLGRHPPGINPRALHALAKGVCLQRGFSWLFVFTFHLQPKQQDRKNKSHGGQVHVGHRERSTLGTSSLLKAGKVGLFSSQVLSSPPARAMQTNGETAQVRRPVSGQTLPLPVLWDRSEEVGVGLMLGKNKMSKGDSGRDGWVIEQVPNGALQQVPRALMWVRNREHS